MPKEIFMIVPGTPHYRVTKSYQQGLLVYSKYLCYPTRMQARLIGHVPLDSRPYARVEVCLI